MLTEEFSGPHGSPPNGNRRFTLQQVLALTVIVALAASMATWGVHRLLYHRQFTRLRMHTELVDNEHFGRFLEVLHLVRRNFVEEPDLDAMLKGATEGAVDALGDPYSFFYDVEEFQGLQISLEGSYEGIGVVVMERDRYTTVQSVVPDTPGALTPFEGAGPDDRPGLMPGDRIVAVDGQEVVGLPVEQVASIIRGPAGTQVTLTVLRGQEDEGDERELTFVITRTNIDVPTVLHRMLDDRVGYLHLVQFTGVTFGAVERALADLQAQGMEGLILDLRDNPGGTLQSVSDVAGFFIPRGPVVHIVTRDGQSQTLSTNRDPLDIPLVVLVNENSASAAEILAGAIQDYGTGTLVGTTTFGKGSVQQIWRLDDPRPIGRAEVGPTGLKITTARYLTPHERSIDGTGITPDVVVEWTAGDPAVDGGTDPQLQRAREIMNGLLP